MTHEYFWAVKNKPQNESYSERKIKADAIKDVILSQPRGTIYAETTPNFIKTFYDVVLGIHSLLFIY